MTIINGAISKRRLDRAYRAGDALADSQALGSGGRGDQPFIDPTQIKIKNSTSGDLPRGSILEIGDKLLATQNRGKQWHAGATPTGSAIDFAILLDACPDACIRRGQLAGTCLARINVTSTSHTHAQPSNGQTLLQSAASGPIKILDTLSATGEQELSVKFVPAQTLLRYQATFQETLLTANTKIPLTAASSAFAGNVGDWTVTGGHSIVIPKDGVYVVSFSCGVRLEKVSNAQPGDIELHLNPAGITDNLYTWTAEIPPMLTETGGERVIYTGGDFVYPMSGTVFMELDEDEEVSLVNRLSNCGYDAGRIAITYHGPQTS